MCLVVCFVCFVSLVRKVQVACDAFIPSLIIVWVVLPPCVLLRTTYLRAALNKKRTRYLGGVRVERERFFGSDFYLSDVCS